MHFEQPLGVVVVFQPCDERFDPQFFPLPVGLLALLECASARVLAATMRRCSAQPLPGFARPGVRVPGVQRSALPGSAAGRTCPGIRCNGSTRTCSSWLCVDRAVVVRARQYSPECHLVFAVLGFVMAVQDRLRLHVQFGSDEAGLFALVRLAAPLKAPDIKRIREHHVQVGFRDTRKLAYSSIRFLLFVRLAAHLEEFLDGLQEMSIGDCHPGKAGDSPLVIGNRE